MKFVVCDPGRAVMGQPLVDTLPQSDRWRARTYDEAMEAAHAYGWCVVPAFVLDAVWNELLPAGKLTLRRHPNDQRRVLIEVRR